MKDLFNLFLIICILYSINTKFAFAVHGGAGSWNRTLISKSREIEIKLGILDALKSGYMVLKNKGTHIDAVEKAITTLEDNPLFNAGKGAKINKNLEIELDASIMDGSTLRCGAIAASKRVKNPVKGARLVMETTDHILISGSGIDRYAEEKGLDIVENSYFFTIERLIDFLNSNKGNRIGTVGAVALDSYGNLAASTSTGGYNNKMQGRIGDSPLIGSGNYANSKTCAVSCTGNGEEMIRNVLSYDIHARMAYKGISLNESLKEVFSYLKEDTGGLIAIDKEGNIEMPYNTKGMARGYVRDDGRAFIFIFGEGEDYTPYEYDLN